MVNVGVDVFVGVKDGYVIVEVIVQLSVGVDEWVVE
jgi:hypothetical protein